MKNKFLITIIALIFLTSCVGNSSTGIFGTGVTIAMDPRTLGTQIDDSIMDKSLDAKLLATNKNYFLSVKTKIIDGEKTKEYQYSIVRDWVQYPLKDPTSFLKVNWSPFVEFVKSRQIIKE